MKFTFSVRSHRSFVISSLKNVSDFFDDFQNVRIKERKAFSRVPMNQKVFVKTGLTNKKIIIYSTNSTNLKQN